VIPTSSFMAWRMFQNKLPTKQNLCRRGVILENNLCVLCGLFEEFESHVFLECHFA